MLRPAELLPYVLRGVYVSWLLACEALVSACANYATIRWPVHPKFKLMYYRPVAEVDIGRANVT
jgi:hypothetical protein